MPTRGWPLGSFVLALALLPCAASAAPPVKGGAAPKRDAAVAEAKPDAGAADAKPADAGAPDGTSAGRDELAQVLQKLAGVEALSARFREEKRMALLAAPLASEGTLHYQRPRMLVRQTDKPRKATLLLAADVLTFGDAQHKESVALSSQPSLRMLVDTFVSVLAGDLPALERAATLRVERVQGAEPGKSGGFRLTMVPRDEKMRRLVQTMIFDGALTKEGATLSRMELVDANGDTTVTTFSDVKFRKAFSEAERARLFRMGN